MRTSGACGARCRRRSEPHSPLREGILPAIPLPAERDHLALLSTRRLSICWERLLFSAKKSVYKAWFPLTGQSLGFDEADIAFRQDPGAAAQGSFHAQLLDYEPLSAGQELGHFEGRWITRECLAVMALTVPHRGL